MRHRSGSVDFLPFLVHPSPHDDGRGRLLSFGSPTFSVVPIGVTHPTVMTVPMDLFHAKPCVLIVHLILHHPKQRDTIITSVFQTEKVRLREVKSFTQSDSATKHRSQDLNQVLCLTPKHALVLRKNDLRCRPPLLHVTKTIITHEIIQSKALLLVSKAVAT